MTRLIHLQFRYDWRSSPHVTTALPHPTWRLTNMHEKLPSVHWWGASTRKPPTAACDHNKLVVCHKEGDDTLLLSLSNRGGGVAQYTRRHINKHQRTFPLGVIGFSLPVSVMYLHRDSMCVTLTHQRPLWQDSHRTSIYSDWQTLGLMYETNCWRKTWRSSS